MLALGAALLDVLLSPWSLYLLGVALVGDRGPAVRAVAAAAVALTVAAVPQAVGALWYVRGVGAMAGVWPGARLVRLGVAALLAGLLLSAVGFVAAFAAVARAPFDVGIPWLFLAGAGAAAYLAGHLAAFAMPALRLRYRSQLYAVAGLLYLVVPLVPAAHVLMYVALCLRRPAVAVGRETAGWGMGTAGDGQFEGLGGLCVRYVEGLTARRSCGVCRRV